MAAMGAGRPDRPLLPRLEVDPAARRGGADPRHFRGRLHPREEEPQIVVPMVDVFVALPGATIREEVENRVTIPLEKRMWEIPGVEYVYSASSFPGNGDGDRALPRRHRTWSAAWIKLYDKLAGVHGPACRRSDAADLVKLAQHRRRADPGGSRCGADTYDGFEPAPDRGGARSREVARLDRTSRTSRR